MVFEEAEAEALMAEGRVRVPKMMAKWSRGGRTLWLGLGLGLGFEWMGMERVEGFDVSFELAEMEDVAVRERPRWSSSAIVKILTFSIDEDGGGGGGQHWKLSPHTEESERSSGGAGAGTKGFIKPKTTRRLTLLV